MVRPLDRDILFDDCDSDSWITISDVLVWFLYLCACMLDMFMLPFYTSVKAARIFFLLYFSINRELTDDIPNLAYYPQLAISGPQLGKIYPMWDWGNMSVVTGILYPIGSFLFLVL